MRPGVSAAGGASSRSACRIAGFAAAHADSFLKEGRSSGPSIQHRRGVVLDPVSQIQHADDVTGLVAAQRRRRSSKPSTERSRQSHQHVALLQSGAGRRAAHHDLGQPQAVGLRLASARTPKKTGLAPARADAPGDPPPIARPSRRPAGRRWPAARRCGRRATRSGPGRRRRSCPRCRRADDSRDGCRCGRRAPGSRRRRTGCDRMGRTASPARRRARRDRRAARPTTSARPRPLSAPLTRTLASCSRPTMSKLSMATVRASGTVGWRT